MASFQSAYISYARYQFNGSVVKKKKNIHIYIFAVDLFLRENSPSLFRTLTQCFADRSAIVLSSSKLCSSRFFVVNVACFCFVDTVPHLLSRFLGKSSEACSFHFACLSKSHNQPRLLNTPLTVALWCCLAGNAAARLALHISVILEICRHIFMPISCNTFYHSCLVLSFGECKNLQV